MQKYSATPLKAITYVAYVITLLMFVVSLHGIINWKNAGNVEHDKKVYTSQTITDVFKYDLVSLNAASQRMSIAPAFTISTLNPNISLFWIYVTGCSIAFVIAFVAVPGYSYYAYKKPVKKLTKIIHAKRNGEPVSLELIEPVDQLDGLTGAVTDLLTIQTKAETFINNIGKGQFDVSIETDREQDHFVESLQAMQLKLKSLSEEERRHGWINQNLSVLEKILKEQAEAQVVNSDVISMLKKTINAGVAALYTYVDKDEEAYFELVASSGICDKTGCHVRVNYGEGMLGQLAIDKQTVLLTELPERYLVIHSGLGSSSPTDVVLVPLLFKNKIYGALEFASFRKFEAHEVAWLERAAESIGAHYFNQKINNDAKEKLQELAAKQANELVEIHRLQESTYHKLELKLKEVQEEKAKCQAILEGCVDAVISFTESGEVNFCNKAAEEVLGMSRAELFEMKIFDIIPMRISVRGNTHVPVYLSNGNEKEITIRTEAGLTDVRGEGLDVLITSTQINSGSSTVFTFFIQKISVDLF